MTFDVPINIMLDNTYYMYCDVEDKIFTSVQGRIDDVEGSFEQVKSDIIQSIIERGKVILTLIDNDILKKAPSYEVWSNSISMYITIREIMEMVKKDTTNELSYSNNSFRGLIYRLIVGLNDTLVNFDLWTRLYKNIHAFCIHVRELESVTAFNCYC